jgi:hypothetical protein
LKRDSKYLKKNQKEYVDKYLESRWSIPPEPQHFVAGVTKLCGVVGAPGFSSTPLMGTLIVAS